jgi:hypothetical protein
MMKKQNWWDKYPEVVPSPADRPYSLPGPGGIMPGPGLGPGPDSLYGAPLLAQAPAGPFDPSYFSGGQPGLDQIPGGFPDQTISFGSPQPFTGHQSVPTLDRKAAVQQAAAAIRGGADPRAVRARLIQMGTGSSDFDPSAPFSDLLSDGQQGPLYGYPSAQFDAVGLGPSAAVFAQTPSVPYSDAPAFPGQAPPATAIGKPLADTKAGLIAAAFQQEDPPEDPLTHMMAAEERGVVQPNRSPATSQRFDPYSEANLTLGPNEQYRADILGAARYYHLTPHSVAASIGAEVGERWNPDAQNRGTNAVGLMQFLPDTWIGEAERSGSFLNGVARRLGFLDERGRMIPSQRRQFLAIRNNPSASIWAGADYAAHNLEILQRQGYVLNATPAAMARYAYIAHHQGLGGARSFLRGIGGDYVRAFRQNLSPANQARYLAANNNDISRAYRNFLSDYVDGRVDVTRYMVNRKGVVVPPTRSLLQ